MNKLEITKRNAQEIIKYAFKDMDENRTKYFTWFEVKTFSHNTKRYLGDYNRKNYIIRIFNVNNIPTINNYIVLLHECSHHIEYTLYRESGHSKRFYEILEKLVDAAIQLGKITPIDIINMKKESRCHNKMLKMANKYSALSNARSNKEIMQTASSVITIEVSNGYFYREYLKARGYRWNPNRKIWYIDVQMNEVEEEKKILEQIKLDFKNVNFIKGGIWK